MTCKTNECNEKHYAQGYCKKCYRRAMRKGVIKVKSNTGKALHGYHGSSEYNVWCNLKSRCDNPKNKMYPFYGGKGITYCDRWKSFENFIKDMGTKPSKKHSLDRIDPYKNYCPENCRWATQFVQSHNKCEHRIFTYNGLTMSEKEWITFLYLETERLKQLNFKDLPN